MNDFPVSVVISAIGSDVDFPQKSCEWSLKIIGYWMCSENRLVKDVPKNEEPWWEVQYRNKNLRYIISFLNSLPFVSHPVMQFCTVHFKNEKDAALFKIFWC